MKKKVKKIKEKKPAYTPVPAGGMALEITAYPRGTQRSSFPYDPVDSWTGFGEKGTE